MKILSWNLLYRKGAAAADVAQLIEEHRPDLVLLQESTTGIRRLPTHAGGRFYELPWKGKTYALAAWSAEAELEISSLELPFSRVPGKFPPRVAQIIRFEGMSIANVHLSHGQLLNRRQLRKIAKSIEGPLAIVGDFNAVGLVLLRGFKDVGPKRITHMAKRVVPFRLDRCLVRDLTCSNVKALKRGPSDHCPMVFDLSK